MRKNIFCLNVSNPISYFMGIFSLLLLILLSSTPTIVAQTTITLPQACNCPSETDADGDGVPDIYDDCPGTTTAMAASSGFNAATGCTDGDGDGLFAETNDPDDTVADGDGDGIVDASDLCPNTPLATAVDATGCEDTDGDAVTGASDPDGTDPCNPSPTDLACFNPATVTTGTGTLGGRLCFDIALSNDNVSDCGPLTGRTPQQADFTQTAINTQTYTFTPDGTVSNVRFYYVNTNGDVVASISGDNSGDNISTPVDATVVYQTSLNADALGLTKSNPLEADIYAVYNINPTNNNTPADDRLLKLSVDVKDCACCGAPTAAGGYLTFMCHNLGADQSADPFTPSWRLNGDYYQYGASTPSKPGPTDGTLGGANDGPVSGWASSVSTPMSVWNTGTDEAPVKGASDPCPSGYRIPTDNELTSIYTGITGQWSPVGTFSSGDANYTGGMMVGTNLYFPSTGYASNSNGSLVSRNSRSQYWSSEENGSSNAYAIYIGTTAGSVQTHYSRAKSYGWSVRCVANY